MLAGFLGRIGAFTLSQSRAALIAAVLSALAISPGLLRAAPSADPVEAQVEVESATNRFPGIVNSNSVFIRCGPAESYYPTLKLDKGAKIMVVGQKLDWLKIVPPEGSFCFISKAFVDRNGDGTAGKVNKDAVNVRAGSALNSLKVVPLCQLSIGMDVKILGEQEEYYKITPPEGKAFVFVNKQFVEPDPAGKPEPINPTVIKPDGAGDVAVKKPVPTDPIRPNSPDPLGDVSDNRIKANAKAATSQPGEVASTTKPADEPAAVEVLFEKAEAEFTAVSGKPLDQQPIASLLAQYEALAASDRLPNTLHRIAEGRAGILKVRAQAADELAKATAAQETLHKKQVALQAERKELEDQLAAKGVAIYTAIGELQSSSLQIGSKTLYRLTDPANGRTVCYLRTDDAKYLSLMGKFLGVKGDLTTEAQLSLKVISPTEVAVVDPAKVNHGVSATVVPPSMLAADDASTAAHIDPRP